MNNSNNTNNITEKITTTNDIDEIILPLYSDYSNNDNGDNVGEQQQEDESSLIGYSCKLVTEQNTVQQMDLVFYMDILTPPPPLSDADTTEKTTQREQQRLAVSESQRVILKEMAEKYQIDPIVSKGFRCFDLPVDGSTWLVQISIDPIDFKEITLFGGCRDLEWDPSIGQDCRFYETRLKGSYIGASATGEDGTAFGDVVLALETLVNGPKLMERLNKNHNDNNDAVEESSKDNENDGGMNKKFETAFLGVPRIADDPAFQDAVDEARNDLSEPVNIKTAIESAESAAQPNRKTITVVGGLLVACFSIAFVLVGYVLYRRRRLYYDRRHRRSDVDDNNGSDDDDENNNNAFARHYSLEKDDDSNVRENHEGSLEDEPTTSTTEGRVKQQQSRRRQPQQPSHPLREEEYPDIPLSAEAIKMDLGNSLKGQLMGRHGSSPNVNHNSNTAGGLYGGGIPVTMMVGGGGNPSMKKGGGSLLPSNSAVDGNESDDVDSWAQTDGTIGSLELQLEPITAEV